MKRSVILPASRFVMSTRGAILTMLFMLLYGGTGFAQESNTAMKQVFSGVKSELKSNDLLSTLMMIFGVLMVVGVAMWLSFRTPKKA